MARIRTVKPEFWTSEQLAECCPTARLLFIGLMTFADDSGIHPDKEIRIKLEIFPSDDITAKQISALLVELEKANLITRYKAGGEKYLRLTGFRRHQRIDQPTYRYPLENGKVPAKTARRKGDKVEGKKPQPKPKNSLSVRGVFDERSLNVHGAFDQGKECNELSCNDLPYVETENPRDQEEYYSVLESRHVATKLSLVQSQRHPAAYADDMEF